jgi:hypothetical protein
VRGTYVLVVGGFSQAFGLAWHIYFSMTVALSHRVGAASYYNGSDDFMIHAISTHK